MYLYLGWKNRTDRVNLEAIEIAIKLSLSFFLSPLLYLCLTKYKWVWWCVCVMVGVDRLWMGNTQRLLQST